MTIDETTTLLRKFGDTIIRPELTVSEVALMASALKLVAAHPHIGDSDVVLNRLVGIIGKLRDTVSTVDESLDALLMDGSVDLPQKWLAEASRNGLPSSS